MDSQTDVCKTKKNVYYFILYCLFLLQINERLQNIDLAPRQFEVTRARKLQSRIELPAFDSAIDWVSFFRLS